MDVSSQPLGRTQAQRRASRPNKKQSKAFERSNRNSDLWALWRGRSILKLSRLHGASTFDEFVRMIADGIRADVRDPDKVSRGQFAGFLQLSFDERLTIESMEIKYGIANGRKRYFRGEERPYRFTLRTVGCVDKTDQELAAFYRRNSDFRSYCRKVAKREEKRAMLHTVNQPMTVDVHAVTKARADARDEAIIHCLCLLRRPMTYDDLTKALARDPAFAAIQSRQQRRQAISNRIKILRKRGRVQVHYRDSKHGLTAFVSLKNPAES